MRNSPGTAAENETTAASLLRRTVCVIPTFNARRHWAPLQKALQQQGLSPHQVLIVDSTSTDGTSELVKRAGFQLTTIPKNAFRHGATRQFAAELVPHAETLIYLTQDALPCGENSFQNLLSVFAQPDIGACYGRQIFRAQADPIEQHARLFNYPDRSEVRSFESRRHMGFRAAFFSNSFAAYRRSALMQVGGFPGNTIVSEEVTVAARMLIAGRKVAYQADATVIHSHPLRLGQEFSRYFDIGVHHGRESWLLKEFGSAGGEAKKFLLSEARYLLEHQPTLLPLATLRNLSKWVSYQLGRHERLLSQQMKERLSAQPDYWADERTFKLAAQSHLVAPSS